MAIPKGRKKKARAPVRKRGASNGEISFDGWEEMTGEQLHRHRTYARDHYYNHYKVVDLAPAVWEWMEKDGYEKPDITAAKKGRLGATVAITCKMLISGCPDWTEKEAQHWRALPGTLGELKPMSDFVRRQLQIMIDDGNMVAEEKKQEEKKQLEKYVPTIQERIFQQSCLMSEKIDTWLEDWYKPDVAFKADGFNIKGHLMEWKCTQAHARKIKEFYTDEMAELEDVIALTPASIKKIKDEKERDWAEQLKEGYAIYETKQLKLKLKAMQNIINVLDVIIESAKVLRKPRKRKPISSEKMVAKLKYCVSHDKLGLVSISPTDIVRCNELWVYNIKSRKIGKYVASMQDPLGQQRDGSGLTVKGTTIQGFNEELSIQKTLRKPEEKLKEFKDAGKIKLKKYMEEINAVEIKLNGRINADTVLLKAV